MTARTAWAAATAALFVPLAVLDRRMVRTGGPGIIAFELAGAPERARGIVDTWGEEGRAAARASLMLDFPFALAYTGLNVTEARTTALVATQVVAGACDAAENATLLRVLGGRHDLAPLARRFALAKFALLGLGWAAAAARRLG